MKLIWLLLIICSGFAQAQSRLRPQDPPKNGHSVYHPQIELEEPLFSGTVCGEGRNSVTMSPDKKAISILFDQFTTEVGSDVGRLVARDVCRMRIPIRVPRGMQMTIVKTDTRGFNSLPLGANAEISTVHHLVDRFSNRMLDRNPFKQVHRFQGPLDQEFLLGTHVEAEQVWSQCGKDLILNIGVQTTVSTVNETAITVIDSLDLTAEDKSLDYHLLWQPCKEGARPDRPIIRR